jgi:hypothetical protein
MRITRKELAKQQRKQAGVVRHFLLTHETVSVTKEKQKDGTFKLADSNARDAAPCFCVEDLARRKSRDVSDLTDGELAEILTRPTLRIEAASVKAERKQRRKHK